MQSSLLIPQPLSNTWLLLAVVAVEQETIQQITHLAVVAAALAVF
jgi:hypothetical protein